MEVASYGGIPLQRATLNATKIKPKSDEPTELLKLLEAFKNYVNLAV